MKKETKTIETYIAEDGKEFLSEKECLDYETKVLSLYKKIKYFKAFSNPDLTEGRGYYGNLFFAVLCTDYLHFERALQFMIEKYGRTIEYVQGVAPLGNYSIPAQIEKDEFDKAQPGKVGDYYNKSEKIFISETKLDGFPEPIWVR